MILVQIRQAKLGAVDLAAKQGLREVTHTRLPMSALTACWHMLSVLIITSCSL